MMMWIVKLFVYCAILKLSSDTEIIQLKIPQGTLKGLKNTTIYHGMPFYSFRGIPYAKPNVGRDKFNAAVLLESWTGVLDATYHGNFCPRLENKKMVGNEDCLFLNIYTPDLNQSAKRAVMVYIHGGAFFEGDGNDMLFGPDFLIEKDVILVTINYRLGVIGFLNTEDDNAPGNVGLKDQNLALKWVEQNIIYFGGCSNRVTLFGQSAGAASVHYHILSPMSRGLFKGAILQSGTAVNSWAFTDSPKANVIKLAKILGINGTETAEIVDKLKDKSAKELIEAHQQMLPKMNIHGIFVPSVEIDIGQDIFLPNKPWKILTSGNISDVPIMIGLTESEVGWLSSKLSSNISQFEDFFRQLIPNDLNADSEINSIVQTLSDFYCERGPITSNVSSFTNLLNDVIFNYAILISAEIMNARISSPVYQYLFNYYTSRGIVKLLIPEAANSNYVLHCDDIVFIFHSNLLKNLPDPGSYDAQKTNEMVEMWTNFAKDGNPSASMEHCKVAWLPMNRERIYLDIGIELQLKNHLWKDRILLWAHLFRKIIDDYIQLFE